MKTLPVAGILLLCCVTLAQAEEASGKKEEAKALSGMAIVGNDDAPKALYIVPWKSSEVGAELILDMPVVEGYAPVDREEFQRKVDFYQVSSKNDTGRK